MGIVPILIRGKACLAGRSFFNLVHLHLRERLHLVDKRQTVARQVVGFRLAVHRGRLCHEDGGVAHAVAVGVVDVVRAVAGVGVGVGIAEADGAQGGFGETNVGQGDACRVVDEADADVFVALVVAVVVLGVGDGVGAGVLGERHQIERLVGDAAGREGDFILFEIFLRVGLICFDAVAVGSVLETAEPVHPAFRLVVLAAVDAHNVEHDAVGQRGLVHLSVGIARREKGRSRRVGIVGIVGGEVGVGRHVAGHNVPVVVDAAARTYPTAELLVRGIVELHLISCFP